MAVQSKVVTAAADDPKPTFDYWCDANDLEYWLNGNTPVILVVSSPASNQAYWASIKHYFAHWTPKDAARITFNKEQDRFTAQSFRNLVSIAAPKEGLYLAATRHPETLYSNLLTLDDYPLQLFIATTDCRTPRDVWALLRKARQEIDGGWVLWEKKVLSFHDLSEQPWPSICDPGTVDAFATAEWSNSENADRRRLFVQLLNQTLRAQLRPQVRYWPKEDCFAITGSPRKLPYESLKRPSRISVVSRFIATSRDGRQFESFRHIAFRGQFRAPGGQWCLEITPTYRFTRDGYTLDRFHQERLKTIKQFEGNRAVLSCVLFWADYLRPKSTLFDGRTPLLRFGRLLTFPCDVGIIDKEWLAVAPESAPNRTFRQQQMLLLHLDDETGQ